MDRRRFLLVGTATTLAACSRTTDPAGSYAGSDTTGTTATTGSTLPPPATSPPTSAGTTSLLGRPTLVDPPGSTTTAAGPPSTTTGTGGPARFVIRAPGAPPTVALTFHTNGDLGLARRMVDIARDHDARFTNFIVGDWLAANPSWARTLLDGGHELANHTYTHPEFTALSSAGMLGEITRCRDVIASLAGDGGRYFRPSGTDDGTATPASAILGAAGEAGYGIVLGWDVEPFDYQDPGAEAVRTRTLDAVRPGSIVSLHFGHQGTADALDGILGGLADKGLAPVTVSDLLAR